MSKARIESFSDGVFSIILTLLVFNFQVPKLSGPDFNRELYTKLVAMHSYCVTYVLSFILISMFWIAHHNLFHNLKHSDSYLLWLNTLFLLFLAFIPFPTQVLGTYPDTEAAAVFFGIAMVLASLSFSLLRYYSYYRGKLINDSISNEYMRKSLIRSLGGVLLYIFAIAMSVYSPYVTLTIYALIPFLVFIPVGSVEKVGGDLSNNLQRDENDNDG
jgi:uncharacterized membrane protein